MPTGQLAPPMKHTRHPNQVSPAMTLARQRQFLELLAQTGRVKQTCDELGMSLYTPYAWAQRSERFAKNFEAVKQKAERVLLAQYEGTLDDVVLQAKDIVDFYKVQNSRFFRMKRLDPLYRDNAQVAIISGPVQITFGTQPANVVENGTTPQGMVEGRVDNGPRLEKR